jgi:hypothetical protein
LYFTSFPLPHKLVHPQFCSSPSNEDEVEF